MIHDKLSPSFFSQELDEEEEMPEEKEMPDEDMLALEEDYGWNEEIE